MEDLYGGMRYPADLPGQNNLKSFMNLIFMLTYVFNHNLFFFWPRSASLGGNGVASGCGGTLVQRPAPEPSARFDGARPNSKLATSDKIIYVWSGLVFFLLLAGRFKLGKAVARSLGRRPDAT